MDGKNKEGGMEIGTPFKELLLNNKPLSECEMVLECNYNRYRLYIDRMPEMNSFYAMAVEFVSCECGNEDYWLCPNIMVEPLFNVIAYFDGVRHLEFNRESDMPGYIYYPNMQGIIEMLKKVRELEEDLK